MPAISLREALAGLKDPRSRRGVRDPFAPMLLLVAVGLLLGRRGFDAISKLRRDYGPGLILALGFNTGRGPSADALSDLLRRLDADALQEALAGWARRLPGGGTHACLDGKTLRGSRDGGVPGVHLLAAYAPEAKAVLGQPRVDAKTNEHKAALQLLAVLPADGNVFTGDAMFCQKDVAEAIRDGGGDYVLIVKDSRPELKADIKAALGTTPAFPPCRRRLKAADERSARTVEKGHGRVEVRELRSTTMLAGHLDWPDACQAFELTRTRVVDGVRAEEAVCGITSLGRLEADAGRLLGLVRSHWGSRAGCTTSGT